MQNLSQLVYDYQISIELYKSLPADQVKRVFSQPMCDIEPVFMGFVNTYRHLAELIPKDWTVIDLGCAYNPQCFYFTEHKLYVAVDNFNEMTEMFQAPNTVIYRESINDFVSGHLKDFNLDETFAILNYVPCWGMESNKIVRESFKNLYVYYPHGGYDIKKKLT